MKRYIGLVDRKRGRKAVVWGLSFPDFPGCVAVGDSLEAAVDSAAEALRFHVEGMREDGLPIPEPRSLDAIESDPEFADDLKVAVVCLVPLLPPGEGAERVNVSLDRGLLREIDQAAKTIGSSRSNFLASAARDRLEGLAVTSRSVTATTEGARPRASRKRA